ncbi:MAG: hypothetical protein JW821_04210 [Deltaproteobacteria bacterium]|nr:hypothetical protein [Deltaproteobacteria bacterium]
MTETRMVADILRELHEKVPGLKSEIRKKAAEMGAFGEFGWPYLIERVETAEPCRNREQWRALQRKITERIIEDYRTFRKRFGEYLQQGLPYGDALEKARESMPPSSKTDREIVEFSLKWVSLEGILQGLAENRSLEKIAVEWGVSHKWIKEIYFDFLEIVLSDFMGKDCYQVLSREKQGELKNLFMEVLAEQRSIAEFHARLKDLKKEIAQKLREVTPDVLKGLPEDRAKAFVRFFLESGGRISERELVLLAADKGIGGEDLEALLSLRRQKERDSGKSPRP